MKVDAEAARGGTRSRGGAGDRDRFFTRRRRDSVVSARHVAPLDLRHTRLDLDRPIGARRRSGSVSLRDSRVTASGSLSRWPVSTATTRRPLDHALATQLRARRRRSPRSPARNRRPRRRSRAFASRISASLTDVDDAVRLANRAHGAIPRRRRADANRRRDRFRLDANALGESVLESSRERRRALGLNRRDARHAIDQAERRAPRAAPCRTPTCCRGCPREARSSRARSQSSCSSSSKTIVFCPSRRNGLTELSS